MEEFIGTFTAKDLSLTLLVATAILMIFKGLLIPIRYYDQMKTNLEQQVAQWRETSENYKAAFEEERRQKNLLLDREDIATHTLTEIREHVHKRIEGGDSP